MNLFFFNFRLFDCSYHNIKSFKGIMMNEGNTNDSQFKLSSGTYTTHMIRFQKCTISL